MSSVNHTIIYVLFVTTILASTTAIIPLIPRPPSRVGVGAFLVGAFAHPFIVLVIYRTILLRERASGDRIVGVERHLILFTTIGMITVLSTLAILKLSDVPSWVHIYFAVLPVIIVAGYLVFAILRILGVETNMMGTFGRICSWVGAIPCGISDTDNNPTEVTGATSASTSTASVVTSNTGTIKMIFPPPYSKIDIRTSYLPR